MKRLVAIAFASLLLAGCASVGTANLGYASGRQATAIFLDTESVQSAELNQTVRVAYAVLVTVTDLGTEDAIDTIIAHEILSATESVVAAEAVKTYYYIAKERLLNELGVMPDAPNVMAVLKNFRKGCEDVLAEYRRP